MRKNGNAFLVIVSLVAALVIPSFGGFGPKGIRADARRVASLLRYLNESAISMKETYPLRIDLGTSSLAWKDPEKKHKLESLQILLEGAMNASKLVGLKMNLPVARQKEILALLPSLQNPTISPLADPAWVAAEVILPEREVRDLIPALKRAGAMGLVEYPLNKVIY